MKHADTFHDKKMRDKNMKTRIPFFCLPSFCRFLTALLLIMHFPAHAADPPLHLATFNVDATPPIGSALCNGAVKPAKEIVTPLTARGVVLLGAGQPIVLCAFDWVGIANESHASSELLRPGFGELGFRRHGA